MSSKGEKTFEKPARGSQRVGGTSSAEHVTKPPRVPREALGVYSYDPTQGEYLYHGFGARGGISKERGQRIAKGFHFTSERGTGVDRVRKRFTIEEAGQGRVNTVSETAKADGPWVVEERVEYLRTRP